MALTKPNTTTAATSTPVEEETVAAAPEVEEQVQGNTPDKGHVPEATEDKQEVAETTEEKAPAKATGGSKFEEGMAEDGFEGLTLGGLSFEQIRLPGEGQFIIGQEDEEFGKEFNCVIQTTRARYVVRQSSDGDASMFYSYDPNGKTNTEGKDMEDTLQEWSADGYDSPEIKKYLEVMATLTDEGDREGTMVMLSIPPASLQTFSGHIAQQQFKGRGKPNNYITTCKVGKKRKAGNSTYFPWQFAHGGTATEV